MAVDAKTKSLPRHMTEAACRVLKEKLDREYKPTGTGWMTRAAIDMDVSQPEMSELYNIEKHPTKGLGGPVLVKLREFLKVSIDDLLGLPPLFDRTEDRQMNKALEERMAALEKAVAGVEYQEKVRTIQPVAAAKRTSRAKRAVSKKTSEVVEAANVPRRRSASS
jgi:hypothetical protein